MIGNEHKHGHSHGNHRGQNRKRLALVLALVASYMVAEVIGGLVTGSLALLADASHMLSDAGALALSLFALWMAQRPAPTRLTYGYYRSEILAALVNGATLVAIALYIFIEAYKRFGAPPEVQGGLMMGIALGGLMVNLVGLWILNAGKNESLNMQGAWLHVLSDALGSLGAITAGALIWAFGWNLADPAASVLIGILVLYSSWSLLKETVAVLMEGAPGNVDVDEVRTAIHQVAGVVGVHDLHVWTITTGIVALSAHVTASNRSQGILLAEIKDTVHELFRIDHITIQVEPAGFEEPDLSV